MDAVQKALRLAKADGGGSVQGSPDAAQTAALAAAPDYGSFLTNLYKTELGRAPDEGGMKSWVDALQSNQMTQDQVRQQILQSPEKQVYDLYGQILNRAPDPAASNWVNAIQSGAMTLPQVKEAIGQSPENQVQDLYSSLLGRSLDPGASQWIEGIGSGKMTGEQVRQAILNSAEYKAAHPNAASGAKTGSGTTTGTGATAGTTSTTTPVDITKQGMPLIYTPPAYKDYGATAAAFRVASGLENLPAPFYTLSPVIGGASTNAGAGGAGGKTSYQQILDQLTGGKTGGVGNAGAGNAGAGGAGAGGAGAGGAGAGGSGDNKTTPYVSDVANLYKSYLGRAPTDAEAQNWANAINSGKLTYNEVVNNIKGSPEATVYGGYKNMLGRDLSNDPAAQNWINALAKGDITQAQFEAGVKSSPEYAQRQIAQAYQQYLGRTPSAQELSPWAGAVTSGAMGLGDVVNAIKTSQEAQGYKGGVSPEIMTAYRTELAAPTAAAPAAAAAAPVAAPVANAVAAAYEQYLGRAPEPGAAEAWAGAITSGAMTADQVMAAIASSAEAQSYAQPNYGFKDGGSVKSYAGGGGTDYKDLINQTYLKYLLRDPEKDGYDQWLAGLESGKVKPEDFVNAVRTSPEYAKTSPYDALVYSAYKTFLGRTPDDAGYQSWLNALTSGSISPADFESRFKGAGYEDDIVGAYQDLLGRAPEPQAIKDWNELLSSKQKTVEDLQKQITSSPEYRITREVPRDDIFSERQGGGMYNIDIGNVERIPQLGRMAAPINVKQAWENSEIARLQKELEDAKKAGTTQARDTSGGGGGGGEGGSNFGASDSSGTAGAIGVDSAAGAQGPGMDSSGASGVGEGTSGLWARGGRTGNNAVDNALRMLKADRR